jgi:hypothetical protein
MADLSVEKSSNDRFVRNSDPWVPHMPFEALGSSNFEPDPFSHRMFARTEVERNGLSCLKIGYSFSSQIPPLDFYHHLVCSEA